MKKITLSVSVFFLSVLISTAQSVDEIVTKHLTARGGIEKLRSIKSIVMENTLGAQGMEFENKQIVLVGKAMRSESKIMGNDMVQAFDGAMAWAIMPAMMGGTGDPQEMPAEMSKGVSSQTDPFPFLDFALKGNKIEYIGTEKIKDKDTYHVKITSKEGTISEAWIGVENGLIAKIKATQAGQEQEVFYSNYKEVEGVSFPMSMEMSNPMAGTITIDTKTIVLNGVLDEAIFKMPGKK
jgi:hypothetical protein